MQGKKKKTNVVLSILLLASVLFVLPATAAPTYTALTLPGLNTDISTWSDGPSYDSIFPGSHTWNSVPFSLAVDQSGNNVYMGTLTISVGIYGVTSAYSLINSWCGYNGYTIGAMEFFGTNGAYYKVNLVEGVNVRDHYNGSFNNTITAGSAVIAWEDPTGGGARLDMQIYNLPSVFASETLESIVFNYYDRGYGGRPFLAAVTVEANAVPLPGAGLLFGPGLAGLALLRRRFRK